MIEDSDRWLVARYFDDELTDEQFTTLQQRLRDDAAVRQRLREEANLVSGLKDLAAGDSAVSRAWSFAMEEDGTRPIRPFGKPSYFLIIAGVAVAATLLLFTMWPSAENRPIPVLLGTLTNSSGAVEVRDANGNPKPVTSGMEFAIGDEIRTSGQSSFATIALADRSRLQLVGDSIMFCSSIDPAMLSLREGIVSADFARRGEGDPIVIATPHNRIAVAKTIFSVQASEQHTDLRVRKGNARLTRSEDGQSVIVPQGKQAISNILMSDVVVNDEPKVSETWEVTFENTLPPDWIAGTLITEGLPEGSTGAVRAVEHSDRWHFNIVTQERFLDGLFVVSENTHVHMTYKMTRPGWLNIFCQVRPLEESNPTDLFLCNNAPFGLAKAQQWYTMTIPMSQWKRKDESPGGSFTMQPPAPGERVYVFNWSAPKPDRGLVIDRVWVTPDGPGRIELEPLTEQSVN